jgi:hypothetical protein
VEQPFQAAMPAFVPASAAVRALESVRGTPEARSTIGKERL